MRAMLAAVFASVLLTQSAWAQATNPPPQAPSPLPAGAPAAPGAPEAAPPAAPAGGKGSKLESCRESARSSGLKGADLADQVQVCLAEARLDCLKEAVAQKIRGPKRRDFLKGCMAE